VLTQSTGNGEDLTLYRQCAKRIYDTLKGVVPSQCPIERAGLDEYFLDFSQVFSADVFLQFDFTCFTLGQPRNLEEENLLSCAAKWAYHLRQCLHEQLGFTCSAGIASSKLASKLASGINKPAQQTLMFANYFESYLPKQAIRCIPGIGHALRKVSYFCWNLDNCPSKLKTQINFTRLDSPCSIYTRLITSTPWEM
jgi:nucleotidyltransferase/DNA polymerase involved in DNA repair